MLETNVFIEKIIRFNGQKVVKWSFTIYLKIFPGLNYNFYVVNKDPSYFFCVHTQVFFLHEEDMKVKEMTCDKKRLREG